MKKPKFWFKDRVWSYSLSIGYDLLVIKIPDTGRILKSFKIKDTIFYYRYDGIALKGPDRVSMDAWVLDLDKGESKHQLTQKDIDQIEATKLLILLEYI